MSGQAPEEYGSPLGDSIYDALSAAVDAEMAAEAPAEGAEEAPAVEESGAPDPATGEAAEPADTPVDAASGDGEGAAGEPAADAPDAADEPAGGGGAGTPPAPRVPDRTAIAETKRVSDALGELTTAYETNLTNQLADEAMGQMREEFANYFNALQAHPRMLQGTEVPAIGREGTEVLRDSDDAREWQEAAKLALQQEAQRRVEAAKAEANDLSQLVHSSVQMFQNNVDLVPGSALFDKELADKFFEAVEPYGVRNEGKLIGYSIPVQPLLDRVRGQLAAQRGSNKPQAAAGAPASAPKAQPSTNKADAPQTGIRSKAGSGGDKDDWDTFASAVGLPKGVL